MIQQRNPLLGHAWGVSRAEDRVWAQICAIAPSSKPWERLFVVLQAYMDESYTSNGVFVLGGYISRASDWAQFSREWEQLLPLTFQDRITNNHRFKMREMASRMSDVSAFYRIIENHVILSIYCKINIRDISRAQTHIWVPNTNIDWGIYDNAYRLAFRCLLDMFHEHRHNPHISALLPIDQTIDLYFDENNAKKPILNGWDDYVAGRRAEVRGPYGSMPRFEREECFLGLQAADFWVWWVRKAYEEEFVDKLLAGDFGYWKGTKAIPGIQITFTEEQLSKALTQLVRPLIEPETHIYNVRFHWNDKPL